MRTLLQGYYGWRTASLNVQLGRLQKDKADKVEALKKAIDFDQVRAMYELVQKHTEPPAPASAVTPVRAGAGTPARAKPAATPIRAPAPPRAAVVQAPAHASFPPAPAVSAPTSASDSAVVEPAVPATAEVRQRVTSASAATPVRSISTPSGLPKHYQLVNRLQPPPVAVLPMTGGGSDSSRGWLGRVVDAFIGDAPQTAAPVLCKKCHRPNPPPPSFYELAVYGKL